MQTVPDVYIERNVSGAHVLLVIGVGVVGLSVYLLPSLLGRGSRRFGDIARLNLLLGWTVIGWVVALLWALKTEDDRA